MWRSRLCATGAETCGAAVLRYPGGRGGSHAKRSNGLGNQTETGSPSVPVSNADEAFE